MHPRVQYVQAQSTTSNWMKSSDFAGLKVVWEKENIYHFDMNLFWQTSGIVHVNNILPTYNPTLATGSPVPGWHSSPGPECHGPKGYRVGTWDTGPKTFWWRPRYRVCRYSRQRVLRRLVLIDSVVSGSEGCFNSAITVMGAQILCTL